MEKITFITDEFESEFLNISNEYMQNITNFQNKIKDSRIDLYKISEQIKTNIFSIISYRFCGEARANYYYSQLVNNIKSEKLKAIVYLIRTNHTKKTIRNILGLSEKTFNVYLNRIGEKLLTNKYIIDNYLTDSKANLFINENGSFKDVYKFINDLFSNP